MNVPPSHKAHIIVVSQSSKICKMFEDGSAFLERLASVSSLETKAAKEGIPANAVTAVFDGGEVYIPLEDLIDIEKELARLAGEKDKLAGEIKRGEGKLGNEQFVNNAPEKVVNAEREKLAKYKEMYKGVEERIKVLSGNS